MRVMVSGASIHKCSCAYIHQKIYPPASLKTLSPQRVFLENDLLRVLCVFAVQGFCPQTSDLCQMFSVRTASSSSKKPK